MRTIYLDCGMGAAGDMLCAALYELLDPNEKETFLKEVNALGIPGVEFSAEPAQKCGVSGTHMKVTVHGEEEESHDHHHDHEHDHHHDHEHHHHSGMDDISHILSHLNVSESVRKNAEAVYTLIAQAESRVHGVPVTEIHFHEVGTMDAIADVTAFCLLAEKLKADRFIASPVHVGKGSVHCAHGILPVPAPATAILLEGIPMYSADVNGELCTPTGAALLKHFVSEFGDMPAMRVSAVGYGMGKKDFDRANCVRAMLGETPDTGDRVIEMRCNLDDMTGERIGFASEMLLEAGALDVWTVPVGMKKSRPGVMLCLLCREQDRDAMVRLLFRHTTTLGVREYPVKRHTLTRKIRTAAAELGEVRVKRSEGYGVVREKYEYEDLARIARQNGISLDEAEKRLGSL